MRSRVYQRGNAVIASNLTPMIDMTFLLIVFFVLVSQITEVEKVEMDLPTPIDPATIRPGDEQRAVINVLPGPGGEAAGYRLGTRTHPADDAGLDALTMQLAGLYEANPNLHVNLRADRATHYDRVDPVLRAIGRAAGNVRSTTVIPRVNLVIERDQ